MILGILTIILGIYALLAAASYYVAVIRPVFRRSAIPKCIVNFLGAGLGLGLLFPIYAGAMAVQLAIAALCFVFRQPPPVGPAVEDPPN